MNWNFLKPNVFCHAARDRWLRRIYKFFFQSEECYSFDLWQHMGISTLLKYITKTTQNQS